MLFIRGGGGGLHLVLFYQSPKPSTPTSSPLFPGLLALQPFFLELKMFHVSFILLGLCRILPPPHLCRNLPPPQKIEYNNWKNAFCQRVFDFFGTFFFLTRFVVFFPIKIKKEILWGICSFFDFFNIFSNFLGGVCLRGGLGATKTPEKKRCQKNRKLFDKTRFFSYYTRFFGRGGGKILYRPFCYCYLVDPGSSHTLVLKIKPYISKCFVFLKFDCGQLIITVIELLRILYR